MNARYVRRGQVLSARTLTRLTAVTKLTAQAALAALVLVATGAPPLARAGEITELSDGPGRDLTIGRCIVCHSVEYIPSNAPAMNRAAWQKNIQKMRERFGAPITDEEAKQILEYLSTNYSGKAS